MAEIKFSLHYVPRQILKLIFKLHGALIIIILSYQVTCPIFPTDSFDDRCSFLYSSFKISYEGDDRPCFVFHLVNELILQVRHITQQMGETIKTPDEVS